MPERQAQFGFHCWRGAVVDSNDGAFRFQVYTGKLGRNFSQGSGQAVRSGCDLVSRVFSGTRGAQAVIAEPPKGWRHTLEQVVEIASRYDG